MQFEFATATRIVFGPGTARQAPRLAASMGRGVLLVTRGDLAETNPLRCDLTAAGLRVAVLAVDEEPTTALVAHGVELARREHCDVVVGFGGGSVIDTGKAVAALLTNGGDPLDYLEVIGLGKRLALPSAPLLAIPTTAGTGAEVTCNAVLGSPEHGVKVSLRSPLMFARAAIVDPELTYSSPPTVTASTGLDAFTQLVEPFVSVGANPVTDALCRDGMRRVARSLRRAWEDGTDTAAREEMALASLFGGLALANAKLGAVHGIAGPLGGMYPAPHGAACAALLPHVMAVNVRAVALRQPDSPTLQRYHEVARIVTGDAAASAADGIAWIEDLCRHLAVRPLREYGLAETDFESLIDSARRASSMKGNPVELSRDELAEILRRAL
ncbi:MAG: iron-containing alcohol dehydrogenase [Planctomycetes bacterium]|nr:iron-containing alcohol dehydrogenase [Planctomycetota bacterium]